MWPTMQNWTERQKKHVRWIHAKQLGGFLPPEQTQFWNQIIHRKSKRDPSHSDSSLSFYIYIYIYIDLFYIFFIYFLNFFPFLSWKKQNSSCLHVWESSQDLVVFCFSEVEHSQWTPSEHLKESKVGMSLWLSLSGCNLIEWQLPKCPRVGGSHIKCHKLH